MDSEGGVDRPPWQIPAALAQAVRTARHIAVLTGAGISAESGVPTFRDAQTGLWAQYRPAELATRQAFRRDPRLVWEWYAWRRRVVAQAAPNPGHLALAGLEGRVPTLTLITQNVDGLHQRAGSSQVIELHGSLARARCFAEDSVVDVWEETGDVPPCCPRCRGPLRPDVVWFGEALPQQALEAAWAAARACDLFLAVGTSGIVEPAASLPYEAVGAVVVEINPEDTPLTANVPYALRGPAGAVLPALVQAAWPDSG